MAVKNEENQQMVSSPKVVSCKKKSKKQRKKERERLNLKQKQSVKQNTSTGKVVNVYHVIVLDESGSMTCVTHQTISGCNETIQTIRSMQKAGKDTQRHFVSIYLFDSSNSRYIMKNLAIEDVREITIKDYQPNDCTPLFDAVGFTLTELKATLQQPDTLGYVTIITDGYENASYEYTLEKVRQLIDELKKQNVIFSFIGANINAAEYSRDLHIDNSMQFEQDDEGMRQMWARERRSKMRSGALLSSQINCNAYVAEDFISYGNCGNYYAEDVDESRISPEVITELGENEIFVFGSNTQGIHNGGASLQALRNFGAVMGQAEGLQGKSYAIPTDGVNIQQLNEAVERFCEFAFHHPELTFLVTAVGCGTAGWTPYDVAPMFQKATSLKNVKLPMVFCDYLDFTPTSA